MIRKQLVVLVGFMVWCRLVSCDFQIGGLVDESFKPYSEDGLPPMYEIEDYFACEAQEGAYCKVEIVIHPKDPNSILARQIEESKRPFYRFLRNLVYRMMCIPKQHINNGTAVEYITKTMNENLLDYNVTLDVSYYKCHQKREIKFYDYIMFASVGAYFCFVFLVTLYTYRRRRHPDKTVFKYDKLLSIFSVQDNWKRVLEPNRNKDYEKLLCIQGIRFYNVFLVVIAHTKLSYGHWFLKNPMDLERVLSYKIVSTSCQIDLFVVQIYFLMSTMLLTNKILELHKTQGNFTLWNCINMYLNRLFRFLPTLSIMILGAIPILKMAPSGTSVMDYINIAFDGCSHSWWASILQMSYLFDFNKICIPGTWYISVDTFFYLTTLILLYVYLKFKLDFKKLIFMAFLGSSLVYGYIIYSNNLDIMYRPNAEAAKRIFESHILQQLYISPFSSWNTGCLGIAVGVIFFNTKNKKIKINKLQQLLWYLIVLVLPVLVVYVSKSQYQPIYRPIVGALLKPTFALAFSVAILGMSQGIGGPIKKVFEWPVAVKLSSFSYCTYLYHFLFVFMRGAFDRELVTFNGNIFWFYAIQDMTLSFILGAFIATTLEQPGLTLQKMYLPQAETTRRRKSTSNGIKMH